MTFGQKLQMLRQRAGMSQDVLAERMGVSRQAVSRWERDEHVACGFDFCHFMGPGNEGARGLEDASQAGTLFFWLEKMGMSRRERELVARENFLRVLA